MKRGKRTVFLTAAFLGVAVFALWRLRGPERLLDQTATRLCKGMTSNGNSTTYRSHWLSERDLLEMTLDKKGKILRLARYDTVAHVSRDMPEDVTQAVRTLGGYVVVASPDGRWLITLGESLKRPSALNMLDHRTVLWPEVHYPIGEPLRFGWMFDRKTYAILFSNSLQLYDTETPGRLQRRSVPNLPLDTRIVGPLPDGLLLFQPQWHVQPFALTRLHVAGPSATLTSQPIPLPHGCTVRDVSVSPDGHTLAWMLGYEDAVDTGWKGWLRTLLHHESRRRWELWLSRLDGSGLREVGYVRKPSDYDHLDGWTPDGRRVTFTYEESLWSVPVEL